MKPGWVRVGEQARRYMATHMGYPMLTHAADQQANQLLRHLTMFGFRVRKLALADAKGIAHRRRK